MKKIENFFPFILQTKQWNVAAWQLHVDRIAEIFRMSFTRDTYVISRGIVGPELTTPSDRPRGS